MSSDYSLMPDEQLGELVRRSREAMDRMIPGSAERASAWMKLAIAERELDRRKQKSEASP